jgi:hypothetical protein
MMDRLTLDVGEQILLADISDVGGFRILGEEVVEGLVLGRPNILGDRLVPFLAIGEDRVDVENHAAKIEKTVPNQLADRKLGVCDGRRFRGEIVGSEVAAAGHASYVGGPAWHGKEGLSIQADDRLGKPEAIR